MFNTSVRLLALIAALVFGALTPAADRPKLKALIIDGQNNHNWKSTTPLLKKYLDETGLFDVEVVTSPPERQDLSKFRPQFAAHQVVVSNYNGATWPAETRNDLSEFVRGGGGFVVVHAADNAFADWPEYNEMIGLGGWGNRTEKNGPYVRVRDGQVVRDTSPGRGGSHGERHPFLVETLTSGHPITSGLPAKWMHEKDELYDRLRGPARNLTVLAYAYSDPKQKGSGEREPLLMTIAFGEGRVFHTTLGHDTVAMKCVGFIATYQRGCEWAATGKVTQPVPADFPTADKVSSRP
jgi:type 1 glutamine amidotransferase